MCVFKLSCFFDVDMEVCFLSKWGPLPRGKWRCHLCFPGKDSRGEDSRNGRSVVRDKVLVKSQAGNKTRQDIRGDRAMLR